MLFVESYAIGDRNSEKFVYPNITKIEVNIDGMPSKLYSKGMLPTDLWDSVVKRYGLTDNLTQKQFYNDKFAVWIDLRTYYDNLLHGSGVNLLSTQDGIDISINRTTGGSGTIKCYMFIVADALFKVHNGNEDGPKTSITF